MTDIFREFNAETRALRKREKCYAGQMNDHLSTRIHFEYTPTDFLARGYTPYILFSVFKDDGSPYVYGPGSYPQFNGEVFELPYELTSRVRNLRLEYSLWFVRGIEDWDGRVYRLRDTEYLQSALDTIAIKPNISCRPPSKDDCHYPMDPCRPPNPCVEPGFLGWLDYFRRHSLISPVRMDTGELDPDGPYSGTEGVTLTFPTYDEQHNEVTELPVPFLTNGRLDINRFLDVIENWRESDNGNIASALKIRDALSTKLDKVSIVDTWDQKVPADDMEGLEIEPMRRVPSRELMYESLSYKTDRWMAIPLWEETVQYSIGSTIVWYDPEADATTPNVYIAVSDNIGVPPSDRDVWSTVSEHEMVVHNWDELVLDGREQVPSAILMKDITDDLYDVKLDRSQLVDGWSEPLQALNIPSERLVKGTIDEVDARKTDVSMAIGEWRGDIIYQRGSTVVHKGDFDDHTIFISTADNNVGHEPVLPGSDDAALTDMSYWAPVRGVGEGSGGTTTKYEYVGDGVSREFRISHDFRTNNVFVQVRRVDGKRSWLVDALVDVSSRDHVTVIFNEPVPENGAVVYISPGGGRDSEGVMGPDGNVDGFQVVSEKGVPDGYAGLDALGHVPYAQLPMNESWDEGTDNQFMLFNAGVIKGQVDAKTSRTYFDRWDPSSPYLEGSVVTHKGMLYISRAGNDQVPNMGNDPSLDDGTFWISVMTDAGDSMVVRRSIRFGNDTDTEFDVVHGMKSYDFIYSIRTTDAERRYLNNAEVYAKDLNTAHVVVDQAPGTNGLVMNLMDCTTHRMASVELATFTEESEEWLYPNTSGNPVFVQTYDSNGDQIWGDAIQNSESGFDPVTVGFGQAQSGMMIVAKADEVISFGPDDLVWNGEADEYQLTIPRSEGQTVPYGVQIYFDDSGQGFGNVNQDMDKVTIGFESNELTGYVVLKRAAAYMVFEEEDNWVMEHNLGRVAGIQVFLEQGGEAKLPTSCTSSHAEAYMGGVPRTGMMVLI